MRRIWLLSLLFAILTCKAGGQVNYSRHYTIRDGLPSNNVRAVFKDSRDILWVGTDAGLCTFDGRKFNLVPLPAHVTTKKVWAIAEDPSGNMWFGTHGSGLLKYDGREFTSITAPQLTSDHIRVLEYSERFGCLLVGTQYGFNSIAEDGIFTYDRDSINDNRFLVMSFLETRDGIVFHTFSDFAYHYNPLTKEVKPLPKESPLNVQSSSASFITSRGDTILGLFRNGLRIVGKNGIRDFHDLGQVFDIKEDTKGKIWIAAWSYYDMKEPGGIYILDGSELRYENPFWGIPGRLMWNFFLDPDSETIFLTTEGEGMHKLINKGISLYPASFFGAEILDIYDLTNHKGDIWATAHDRIFFGNEDRGYEILDEAFFENQKMHPLHKTDSAIIQPPGKFLSMYVDNDQSLWIGSVNALYKLKSSGLEFYRFNLGKRFSENFVIFPDGSAFSGAWSYFRTAKNIYKSDNYNYFGYQDKYPLDVNHIIARGNELWFSSFTQGLYRYKEKIFTRYHEQNSSVPANLSSICLDASNNIVIGTTDGRVLILEGSDSLTMRHELNSQTGITGNEILWLLNDSKNRLWIGTNMGLNIVNLNQLYQSGHAEIHYINESEGYLDYSIRAAIQDQKGIIWLGGQNNLVRIDPEKLLQAPANSERIELTGLEINFMPVHWDSIADANPWRNVPTGKVTFGHRQNNLTFSYTVDNLINPDKVMYSHFLEGFFTQPAEYTNTSEVTFTNLPPGRYTLVVNAYNLQSRFRYQPLEFHFRILPPWWQTWYFYAALGLLILLVAFLVMQYRVRQVKQIEHLKAGK
jgi:ligand-binding sensor domain-containing protein